MAASIFQPKDVTIADADTLTFTLSTGGDVVIKLRSDLAPGHVERIAGLARDGFNDEPHVRGTCSMARTQNPNSANSQFFICFDDARFLDKQYTVWGNIESGMEYIDALPVGEPPRDPGKIVKATVA